MMNISTSSALPFYEQYPAGYTPPATAAATSSSTGDIVDIRGVLGGTFTADAGDKFALSGLYRATAPTGSSIAGYQVAMRSEPADPNQGQLLLSGTVTNRTSFTAAEFDQLSFVAGSAGLQDLVVVAQTGTQVRNGPLINITDSPAVQITADVTGTRSINALGALITAPSGSDTGFVNAVQQADIFTGTGGAAAGPTLTSVGVPDGPNVDPADLAGLVDAYQSSQIILSAQSNAPSGSAITTYYAAAQYASATGNSLSSATSGQATTTSVASWLLSNSGIGGLETGGSNAALQSYAIAAYEASQQST